MKRFLSLGAGVQSSTLYLMAAAGELEHMPDAAVFADTGWEPAGVYAWLDYLEAKAGGVIPIHRVSSGDIRADLMANAAGTRKKFASLPVFVTGAGRPEGMLRRQCTYDYKVEPIRKKVGTLAGLRFRQRRPTSPIAEIWMGISLDEAIRMKPSRVPWITHRFPLIDMRLTRRDCLRWWADRDLPAPPKSACIGCPYTDDRRWREMKDTAPEEFADAVAVDAAIRNLPRIRGEVYLHRSMRPLDEVDFSTVEERGQTHLFDDAFADECEGMCGV